MFIDKDSIQVKIPGMSDYISLGKYLVEAKYGFNKLWSSDSGRNLAGSQSGTLVGIFPKLIVQFGKLTREELEIGENGNPSIIQILDSPTQSLKYYDPNKKAIITIDTYTGDYEITNKRIIKDSAKNEGFGCSFIAIRKRV